MGRTGVVNKTRKPFTCEFCHVEIPAGRTIWRIDSLWEQMRNFCSAKCYYHPGSQPYEKPRYEVLQQLPVEYWQGAYCNWQPNPANANAGAAVYRRVNEIMQEHVLGYVYEK